MKIKQKYSVTDRLITRITGWISGIVVIILFFWGAYSFWEFEVYVQTNDAQVEEYINPIISRADGFITAVKFEENEIVKKGDTLILIDNREYVIQQRQTEASVEKVSAELIALEFKIQTIKSKSKSAKSTISVNQANLTKENLDFKRYQKLYDEESATKQQLEDIEAKYNVIKSKHQASLDEYDATVSQINDIQAEKAILEAEKNRLEALLDRHKLDVSYTIITASYDGRMGKRTIEVGQMIDVGEVLAYIVNNETDKWIVANYKETQIEDLQIGDYVMFDADAYHSIKFKGVIISMSPATGSSFSLLPPDNATGNYVKIVQRIPVRIKVIEPKEKRDLLKAGMNVNVYIKKTQKHV